MLSAGTRFDLLLTLEDNEDNEDNQIVRTALRQIVSDTTVYSLITNLLGADAELYELSALISDPGSKRQTIHPDTPHNDNDDSPPSLLTFFVALQDVTQEMGPTVFLPATNNKLSHDSLNDKAFRDEFLSKSAVVQALLDAGDCSIFDSRTLHCGTGNESETRRTLFYVSFRNVHEKKPSFGTQNYGSLHKTLRENPVSLEDLLQHTLHNLTTALF